MLNIRRILFPTDFSTRAEGAFSHAAYLAQQTEAELHVLHVVEDESATERTWPDPSRMADTQISMADVYDELRLPMPERTDEPDPFDAVEIVETEVVDRSAADAILDYASDEEIDLIIMGTHGRRGFRRLLMGSVAEEVVRLAPCPVFTVGGRETYDHWAIRRIVAPVDFSEHAHLAARHAAALAAIYQADLTLLVVIDAEALPTAEVPFLGAFQVSADDVIARTEDALRRQATALERDVTSIRTIETVVRLGRPASTIVDYAAEHEADLLVLGSHGRTGMQRLLLGSVAEQVIRSAGCPVFTVKNFGKSLLTVLADPGRPEANPLPSPDMDPVPVPSTA